MFASSWGPNRSLSALNWLSTACTLIDSTSSLEP